MSIACIVVVHSLPINRAKRSILIYAHISTIVEECRSSPAPSRDVTTALLTKTPSSADHTRLNTSDSGCNSYGRPQAQTVYHILWRQRRGMGVLRHDMERIQEGAPAHGHRRDITLHLPRVLRRATPGGSHQVVWRGFDATNRKKSFSVCLLRFKGASTAEVILRP